VNELETQLAAKLGLSFSDIAILREAITHRSFLNENPGAGKHNERLEFLGDAVLELVVTENVFNNYPELPEGEMTALRAAVVRKESLSEAAKGLGLDDFLRLSRGESKNEGVARDAILANAFEALLGAIYLDQGYVITRDFILGILEGPVKAAYIAKSYIDAKSRLQEHLQAGRNITPSYKLLGSTGPDHQKEFVVGVYAGPELLAEGTGNSKQVAEMDAAQRAITILGV
jgi:ribonuclease-3